MIATLILAFFLRSQVYCISLEGDVCGNLIYVSIVIFSQNPDHFRHLYHFSKLEALNHPFFQEFDTAHKVSAGEAQEGVGGEKSFPSPSAQSLSEGGGNSSVTGNVGHTVVTGNDLNDTDANLKSESVPSGSGMQDDSIKKLDSDKRDAFTQTPVT